MSIDPYMPLGIPIIFEQVPSPNGKFHLLSFTSLDVDWKSILFRISQIIIGIFFIREACFGSLLSIAGITILGGAFLVVQDILDQNKIFADREAYLQRCDEQITTFQNQNEDLGTHIDSVSQLQETEKELISRLEVLKKAIENREKALRNLEKKYKTVLHQYETTAQQLAEERILLARERKLLARVSQKITRVTARLEAYEARTTQKSSNPISQVTSQYFKGVYSSLTQYLGKGPKLQLSKHIRFNS